MSGDHRAWILPVIVVAMGLFIVIRGITSGTLNGVVLKPVNWAGIGLMVVGLVASFVNRSIGKLAGVLIVGIGAILVICL